MAGEAELTYKFVVRVVKTQNLIKRPGKWTMEAKKLGRIRELEGNKDCFFFLHNTRWKHFRHVRASLLKEG